MPQPPHLEGPDAFMRALEDPGRELRERYRGDPEALAIRFGLCLPEKPVKRMIQLGVYDPEKHGPDTPGLRELVLDVCLHRVMSAVAVGPRGGGKSMGVSFIEFYLWIIELYDALNLGGSELQASNVYDYLVSYIETDPYWRTLLKAEPKISESWTIENAWIRVLTASQKSVRSPHAGGIKRDGRVAGGLLVIDEEAEADPAIVAAALPTVNTARPSVNVRCSTFHNAEGSFAEVVDNAEEMGYAKYQWDIFDVCEPCDCVGGECQSEEKCFREDHYEEFDNEAGETERKLIHKAYCGGRAQYSEGWIPMPEVRTLWRRMKRNHSRWEVEAMGSRPSSSGHVIKDQKAFENNFSPLGHAQLYQAGAPVYINVDWGSVAAGISVWQRQWADGSDRHVQLHSDLIMEAGQTQIFGNILHYWNLYPEAEEVRADIGGGGNYLNPKLRQDEGIPCEDVNFAEMKEASVAVWNIINETEGGCVYSEEQEDFKSQGRNWKRRNGRIQKGNDHLMDANICYFSKYIEEFGMTNIRIIPRGFATDMASHVDQLSTSQRQAYDARGGGLGAYRVAAVRGFGAR